MCSLFILFIIVIYVTDDYRLHVALFAYLVVIVHVSGVEQNRYLTA